jgi:hypothetical protein
MSNTDKQLIKVEELQDFNKWIEVLRYSDSTYLGVEKYLDKYNKAKKLLKEPIDWLKIFDTLVEGVFFEDWDEVAERYIRFVEAHYKTPVKDGKHLQELTGTDPEQYHPDLAADVQRLFPNKDYEKTEPVFLRYFVLRVNSPI